MVFFLILTVYSLPLLIIHTFIMFYHSALLVTLRHSPPSYSCTEALLVLLSMTIANTHWCSQVEIESACMPWQHRWAILRGQKEICIKPRLKYVVDDVTAGQWLATTVCWIHICLLSSPARGSEDTYARPVWWVAYRQSVSSTLHVHLW